MSRLEYLILQSHYPKEATIILDKTSKGGKPVNTVGKVLCINKDLNVIYVRYDDGKSESLTYGEDMFHRYFKRYI